MSYAICLSSVIPMRKEAAHRSEMVSQLLFGEMFNIIDSKNEWLFIETHIDKYRGWIVLTDILRLSNEESIEMQKKKPYMVFSPSAYVINQKNQEKLQITQGGLVYDYKGQQFKIGENSFETNADIAQPLESTMENIVSVSKTYLNTPYLWGGRSPFGIDCSGFSQIVFRFCGIEIPRDAYQQASFGKAVASVNNSQAGDLAFFDNEEGRITHVGIIIDKTKIIHASGKVRIDSIDHTGIFNEEIKKYSHKLRSIRRFL